MINFNSLWRNVAEHGFPEAGKPESLIGKHCRLAETKEPIVIVDRISQYEGLIFFKSGKRLIRGLDPKHIEYLDDSEEAFREIIKEATKDLLYEVVCNVIEFLNKQKEVNNEHGKHTRKIRSTLG